MPNDNTPTDASDEDVQGHSRRVTDEDDVEGHTVLGRTLPRVAHDDDDVHGHGLLGQTRPVAARVQPDDDQRSQI